MMTPLMIWSAPMEIDSHACSAESSIATRMAVTTPTMSAGVASNGPPNGSAGKACCQSPAARNPAKAPDSIIPSMPMFTMPERSFMTPHRAPRAMGVARPSTMGAMPGVTSIT